jgi:MerR family copper efflux transcriptional regulator
MKIGELAERSGVAASAIRYYEREGLLPKTIRGVNGYRRYDNVALERLHLIQLGQNLGFTLGAIRDVLALQGTAYQDGLMQNLEIRLAEINQLMETLSLQRESLLDTRRKLLESGLAGVCPNKYEPAAKIKNGKIEA